MSSEGTWVAEEMLGELVSVWWRWRWLGAHYIDLLQEQTGEGRIMEFVREARRRVHICRKASRRLKLCTEGMWDTAGSYTDVIHTLRNLIRSIRIRKFCKVHKGWLGMRSRNHCGTLIELLAKLLVQCQRQLRLISGTLELWSWLGVLYFAKFC